MMQALGMTQLNLAEEIGINIAMARRVLAGQHKIGGWMSEKIRVAFGLAESRLGRDVLRPTREPGGERGQSEGGAA